MQAYSLGVHESVNSFSFSLQIQFQFLELFFVPSLCTKPANLSHQSSLRPGPSPPLAPRARLSPLALCRRRRARTRRRHRRGHLASPAFCTSARGLALLVESLPGTLSVLATGNRHSCSLEKTCNKQSGRLSAECHRLFLPRPVYRHTLSHLRLILSTILPICDPYRAWPPLFSASRSVALILRSRFDA